MPNILANDKFLPELLQEQVTAENLASEAEKFLVEEEYSNRVQEKLEEVHSMLHLKKEDGRGGTASERAATIALELAGVEV
jgi:lipid-A-disaccharide synthase